MSSTDELDAMTSVPEWRLDAFESQATFRTLLDTLARPGTIAVLPAPFAVTIPAVLCLPLALADLGVPIAVVGDGHGWANAVARATGALVTEPERAWALSVTAGMDPAFVGRLPTGSPAEPEQGARVALAVDTLGDGPLDLLLSGPGVPGVRRLRLGGPTADTVNAIAARNGGFPAGIDTWFVSADGRIAALSRTTRIEITEVGRWDT